MNSFNLLFILFLTLAITISCGEQLPPYPFNDPTLSSIQRAVDLLSRLTLEEKIGMLFMDATMAFGNDTLPKGGDLPSTAVPRLGVPQFNWMSQGSTYRGAANGCTLGCCTACPSSSLGACCHEGNATQLPQGTGIASTWNPDLVFSLGTLIADESRGIQNGLPGGPQLADYRTGASSVINILRHGLWGRAPETYGECPILTGEIAIALNKGLMGYEQRNATVRPFNGAIKVLPIVRHFIAYAGPDSGRFSFDAIVSEDDLRLTFLPAWNRLASENALGGVMSAISSLNSIPSAAHKSLLSDILKDEFGFDGFVISDCDTISAISQSFHYTSSVEQAAAAALKAGGDLNCGPEYALLLNATVHGLVSEIADINPAVQRLLVRRVQVGDFDLIDAPYTNISFNVVDSPLHRSLARQAVRESVVLLHNGHSADGKKLPLPLSLLPGDPDLVKNLLIVGPSADDASIQAHTYHGTPREWITVLTGMQAIVDPYINITVLHGCDRNSDDMSGFAAAITAATTADAVIYVGGLEASMEEEDTDRESFALPGVQLQLIQALHEATEVRGTPVVAIIISGGPVSEPWMASLNASRLAWLWVSYFGQDGSGIADVVSGAFSPSGRLPFTMPVNTSQIGDITDYDMRGPPYGRTYRYLRYPTASGGNSTDGFAELDGIEVECPTNCLTGWITCDNSSVPGQCTWPRTAAVQNCAAWPACSAVTCNGGRSDCQARGDTMSLQSNTGFTSFARNFPSEPLFPFGFGLSYANIRAISLVTNGASMFTLGDTVSLLATMINSAGPAADTVVAVFGAFMQCDGSSSSVPALPLRTLLTFTKVNVAAGSQMNVTLSFPLTSLRVPGVERQAFPGLLRVWVGDGGICNGCASTTLQLTLGRNTCETSNEEL